MSNDNIQHGIDDNPHNDAEKGAALGGVGGAAVGAAAGSLTGPVGALIGAVAGGLAGAAASGAGVAAVDQVDNDNTMTGLGDGVTPDVNNTATTVGTGTIGHDVLDTRSPAEKAADAVTGDRIDDKTGRVV